MNPAPPPDDIPESTNRTSDSTTTAPNLSAASAPQPPKPSSPSWSSQTPAFSAAVPKPGATPPVFPQFSASTAEILKRLQANSTHASGTPAFEAKRAELLQNYVTSDKLPTPPPIANAGRRGGRGGGRGGAPSALKTAVGAATTTPGSGATPTSARGSGRGRGRGRGGGRGGKRKRAESVDSDEDDSDISSSYTPLPTKTKSGRSVNKPVSFVPTLPEPTPTVKRRRSTKTILAAQCKICHRGTDPGNNRIVFCDVCNTAYHQYCHNPPIDSEVVNVLEKEWLCGPCGRSKQNVMEGIEGLEAGEGLAIEEKRAYLSTLPASRLVTLLLHATIRHPELPLFPSNVHDLIPESMTANTTASTKPQPPAMKSHIQPSQPTRLHTAAQHMTTLNGLGSTGGTPRSQQITDPSDVDPAEAQLLGEIHTQQPPGPFHPTSSAKPQPSTTVETHLDEYDDGYDTDPPAHYPKAGNGLARTLRPESEDLQWLVDDNFEVFSHGWKGDGTGLGADAPGSVLNGLDGDSIDGLQGSVEKT